MNSPLSSADLDNMLDDEDQKEKILLWARSYLKDYREGKLPYDQWTFDAFLTLYETGEVKACQGN